MPCRPCRAVRLVGASASMCDVFVAQTAFAQPAPDEWKFSLGLGVASAPLYPGGADTKVRALPVLSANHGRFFIGGVPGAGVPAGVGAYLVQDQHWRLGVGLGGNIDKPRKESDSPRLRGLGDIDRTALGALFGSYVDPWFELRAGVLGDIGGKRQGTRVSLDAELRYALTERLMFTGGPGLTWADGRYTQTFFGIDAAQSASSGRAEYRAKSGINAVRIGLGAQYGLTQHWGLGARVIASTLRGAAADSPITEKRSQNTFAVFASYRF